MSGDGGRGGSFGFNAVVFGCCSLCLAEAAELTAPAQLVPARGWKGGHRGLFYKSGHPRPLKRAPAIVRLLGPPCWVYHPLPLWKSCSLPFTVLQHALVAFVPVRERNKRA